MNLRLPVIAGVVVVAASVAAFRGLRPASPPPSAPPGSGAFTIATGAPVAHVAALRPARATVTVYVAGRVVRAGVYAVPVTARAVDALKVAGGATSDADLVAVNLAEPVSDGEEIVVPQMGTGADAPAASDFDGPKSRAHRARHRKRKKKHARHHAARSAVDDTSGSADAQRTSDVDAPTHVVDLNTADENELETLPGVGSSLAERIVRFRELNGPFVSTDDLLDVGGMTQSRLDALAQYVSTK